MADNNYLAVSGDWTAHGNWSLGADPTSSDTPTLRTGSYAITTNVPAAGAGINYAGFKVGGNFTGQLGTAAFPFYVGSVTAAIDWQGNGCNSAFLNVDTGDSSSIDVKGTGPGANALVLGGPGTWAEVRVHAAKALTIAANAVVTRLVIVNAGTHVRIESGATVGEIVYYDAGVVDSLASLGTVRGNEGLLNQIGSTTADVTALYVAGTFRFNFHSSCGTITLAELGGRARLDCDGGTGAARTITTAKRYGGTINLDGKGESVVITNDYAYGGDKATGGVGTSPSPAS